MFLIVCILFFKQKTAYEMRISDWSSDVCSSDLGTGRKGEMCLRSAAEGVIFANHLFGVTVKFVSGDDEVALIGFDEDDDRHQRPGEVPAKRLCGCQWQDRKSVV